MALGLPLARTSSSSEEIYGSLWRSLVRWLVANVGLLPSQRLALRADKLTFNTDENVDGHAAGPRLVGRAAAGGAYRRVAASSRGRSPACRAATIPGQYHVGLGRLPEGRYSLRVRGHRQERSVGRGRLRRARKPGRAARRPRAAERDEADRRAERRGGRSKTPIRGCWPSSSISTSSRTRPERTAQTMAWDRWWVLLGAFAVWGAAWGLRRRSGLV